MIPLELVQVHAALDTLDAEAIESFPTPQCIGAGRLPPSRGGVRPLARFN